MGQVCSSKPETGPEQSTVPHFKIVVIGPKASGKSCLIERYMRNRFSPEYNQTTRAQIIKSTKGINLPGYGLVSITLWDCPGEEDIDLRGTYYRDASAVIVSADLSVEGTLETAVQWKDDFYRIGTETVHNYLKVEGVWVDSPTSQPISELTPVVLLGTKYDLVWDGDNNSLLMTLDKIAESHGFKACIPVTSRWNDGSVLRAVQTVVRLLLDRRNRGDQDADDIKVENALAGPNDAEAGLSSKGGPPDYGLFESTGCEKVDNLFTRVNPCYARLLEWQYHFTREIRKFRQYCRQAGVIEEEEEEGKQSWDNVLIGLKHLVTKDFKSIKLTEEEVSGYLQLEGADMTGAEIPPAFDREEVAEGEENRKISTATIESDQTVKEEDRELTRKQKLYVVMTHFNIKLAPVIHVVAKDGTLLIDFLRSLDTKIVDAVITARNSKPQNPLVGVEENRVRLTHLEFQIQELVDMVHTFVQKLRIAML